MRQYKPEWGKSFWETDCGMVFIGLVLVFAIFMILVIYAANRHQQEHKVELISLGCELFYEAPTGRNVYCGKACFRKEMLQMYTCRNGTRVEIDGNYAGGVK